MLQPRLVEIPEGDFWMGENDCDKFANDTERPRHLVRIRHRFQLGVFPVTVGEYRKFRLHRPLDDEHLPVVQVTWLEAQAYCAFLEETFRRPFRLPTETEWEYAARAGSITPYPWGDSIEPADANFFYDERANKVGRGYRTPVGAYPKNAFGLYDMHGNVCEWVSDRWHATYQGAPTDESSWSDCTTSSRRVLRGGAWDYMPRLLRSSWRDSLPEDSRRDNVGFRVACDL